VPSACATALPIAPTVGPPLASPTPGGGRSAAGFIGSTVVSGTSVKRGTVCRSIAWYARPPHASAVPACGRKACSCAVFVRRHRLRVLQRAAIRQKYSAMRVARNVWQPIGATIPAAPGAPAEYAPRIGLRQVLFGKAGRRGGPAGAEQGAFEIVANAGGLDIDVRFAQHEDGGLGGGPPPSSASRRLGQVVAVGADEMQGDALDPVHRPLFSHRSRYLRGQR